MNNLQQFNFFELQIDKELPKRVVIVAMAEHPTKEDVKYVVFKNVNADGFEYPKVLASNIFIQCYKHVTPKF